MYIVEVEQKNGIRIVKTRTPDYYDALGRFDYEKRRKYKDVKMYKVGRDGWIVLKFLNNNSTE